MNKNFKTLSCAHYTIFSVVKLDLFMRALLLDRILALEKITHAPLVFNCFANVFIIFLSELVLVLILLLLLVWHPLFLYTHPSDNGRDQYNFNNIFFNCDIFIYRLYVCISYNYVFVVHMDKCLK